jgi:hypothetical protein
MTVINSRFNLRLFFAFTGLVVFGAISRLIPHPPNFTAITAMALFAGFAAPNIWVAVAAPFLSMAIADTILGYHPTILAVYVAFLSISVASFLFLRNRTWKAITVGTLAGSLWFWVISNLGVWVYSGIYPRDFGGLTECYTMAIPFLEKQVAGDVFYSAIIFSCYALALKIFSSKTYSST